MNNNSILPSALKDEQNLAIEKCIKEALNIDIKKIMIYPIENCSEELLTVLAKENHVMGHEGWNLAKTKEQKQKVIINSIPMHAKKGSKQSIIEALKNIGIDAEIEPFWIYGGRPAHFQMKFINIFDSGIDELLEKNIKELINTFKPKSRILDFINYYLCSKGRIFVSSRTKSNEKVIMKTNEVVI